LPSVGSGQRFSSKVGYLTFTYEAYEPPRKTNSDPRR
jgi:hypothetical protein